MDQETPLHTLLPTSRFADRAEDYRRFRPSYPVAAIDAVLSGLGDPTRLTAADVGAGTGISTRLLAERGARVIAVEPNAAMREAAEPHANVRWVDAPAERTGLDDASVDLVLCAQAFHWFEPEGALAEFHRILRPGGAGGPGGRIALVWNDRNGSDAFTAGYTELIRAGSGNHPAEKRVDHPEALMRSSLFRDARPLAFPYRQPLDQEGVLGRARSASYCPSEGPAWERLREGLIRLHQAHRDATGTAYLAYVTRVYLAERC